MAADFIGINIDRPSFVGTHQDCVAAIIFCQTDYVDYSFINGKKVVDQGVLKTVDLASLVAKSNNVSRSLLDN